MLNDEFLKERQNIREKMLKFSRAMSQGRPLDDDLKDEFSDTILKRRLRKNSQNDDIFDKKSSSNIYLKEDLINVKLEEKQSISKKILSKLKKESEKKEKNKKLFGLFSKKSDKNIKEIPKSQSPKNQPKPLQTNLAQNTKINTKQGLTSLKNEQKNKAKSQNLQSSNSQNLRNKNPQNANPKALNLQSSNLQGVKSQSANLQNLNSQKQSLQSPNKQSPNSQNPNLQNQAPVNQGLKENKEAKNNITQKSSPQSQAKQKPELKINSNLKQDEPKSEKAQVLDQTLINEQSELAKNELLQGYALATQEDRNLNLNHIFAVILCLSFALFLFIPQIYIRNHIYYLSREIATLRAEESVLNEENKELKSRLENMRFQNQILDYLE